MAVLTVSGNKKESASIALAYAGLAGAFTNTLFVMSGIFILYKEAYAQAVGVAGEAVLDVIMGGNHRGGCRLCADESETGLREAGACGRDTAGSSQNAVKAEIW